MKLLIMPNKEADINKLTDTSIDGFILGLDKSSVETNFTLSILDIEKVINLIKENKKEVFVSLNKNIHESELLILEQYLKELEKLNIDGLFFYDMAILNVVKKLSLNIKLIWAQDYLTTNYHTINYYQKHGITGTMLASEITIKEIIDIKKNTSSSLFLPIFGYFPMSTSRRYLVSNYLKFIKKEANNDLYYLFDKNKEAYYPIIEDEFGTHIYNSSILNGLNIEELNNIDYGIINGFNIDITKMVQVIKGISNKNYLEITEMFDNIDEGFFYKETIYKVKKNG